MPIRSAPAMTAAQEFLAELAGVNVATESAEQIAGREWLSALMGGEIPTAAARGEDYWTAHEVRRRPAGLPYTLPPQPGVFGDVPAELEWISADSSNVERAAYLSETNQMYVQFLSGAVYRYDRVPPSIWSDYLASNSKGMFIYYIMRGNGSDTAFPYTNLRPGQRQTRKGNMVTPIFSSAERRAGKR